MKILSFLVGSCGALLAENAVAQALSVDKNVSQALEQVRPDDIKAHIQYLADDKLKGRMPGTEGYQMAVDYVTGQYKKLGVLPAGEKNTYLQRVRLRRGIPDAASAFTVRGNNGAAANLVSGKDYVLYPNPEAADVTVEAPLVFAGYGISAPALGYDDYAGLDAKGKIVVIVRGAPKSFSSSISASSMDMHTVLSNALQHGAVGVLVGSTNPRPTAALPNLHKGVYYVLGADGKVSVSRNYISKQIKVLGNVNAATLHQFLRTAAVDTAKAFAAIAGGHPASAALKTTVAVKYHSRYQDFDSYNVVGKIPGSDARLKDEYVVHSAHLDHVGYGAPVKGDSLYNGAHDNASGVASLLEIAKVYSRLKEKPKRSVLLVMVTGEEMGLLGSAYFAKNPTVPVKSIVADINTDMPTIIAPLLSVVALGAEHSSLEKEVAKASSYLGLTVEQDPEPEQNRFIRSDQYSFVAQGIPALHIKYGNKTADGQNNLNQTVQKWRAEYYHKPQDDINGTFDFEAGKKYVQLNFLIGYQIAQNPQRPTWNTGDFFAKPKM
ncbi:M28 family peptidase [Hymenobacter jejuensis]|uniref:M20/M25/M40 family metallo-hydrolase n=1 Tax=Hymenobacter jejuensis TaxID=2502781 RepID=A0A5B8A506_9BACT|nr:M28 family peptidase [Hymenobacter jejuensis]QDA62299.1 M20/M25/M40 family metallo-hydrolase [Hymenobacter jejuensis]